MPTYENMYYYLEHSIREALQDLEQQNFGAAKRRLRRRVRSLKKCVVSSSAKTTSTSASETPMIS